MKFKVYPYRPKLGMGNIVWAERNLGSAYYRVSKYAMNRGKFPADHPAAPGWSGVSENAQMGGGDKLAAFRARGYWASCFPEGDGITWKPERGRSDERCMMDIRECFGWDAVWAPGVKIIPSSPDVVDAIAYAFHAGPMAPKADHG